jgi:hypothetical protein
MGKPVPFHGYVVVQRASQEPVSDLTVEAPLGPKADLDGARRGDHFRRRPTGRERRGALSSLPPDGYLCRCASGITVLSGGCGRASRGALRAIGSGAAVQSP